MLQFYIEALTTDVEARLMNLLRTRGLPLECHWFPIPDREDVEFAYALPTALVFDFVKSPGGQAVNIFVSEDGQPQRPFPIEQLMNRSTLPSEDELRTMVCRPQFSEQF